MGGFSEVLAKEVAAFGVKVTVVEPGGMRTDWAGSSMHVHDVGPDYRDSVGAVARGVRDTPDAFRTGPAKAAKAILRIASEKEPPLHLLLGSDAVFLAKASAQGAPKKTQSGERSASRPISTG